MAKIITRTIASSQIVVGELQGTEVVAIGSITEEGKVDQEKALKIVRKAFPSKNVLVLDIVQDEAKYKISIEDFIANAEKVVEDEEVEQTEIQYEDTDSVTEEVSA